jgi:hypothetical protein
MKNQELFGATLFWTSFFGVIMNCAVLLTDAFYRAHLLGIFN